MRAIRRYPDAEAVSRAAAQDLVEVARAAIVARGRFCVALSGGSTPRRMYEILSEAPRWARLEWDRVEFFWGDERPVPPDHPDSNFGMARAALLDPLGIDPQRIHRIAGERDAAAAARDYEVDIARVLGARPVDPPPRLDLILLGMGDDGHTASLFPYTRALSEAQRWVVANDVPQLSTRRITITFPVIERAPSVLVLVAGEAKARALAEVLEGPPDPERLPSQRLLAHEGTTWLVDAAAASLLRGDLRDLQRS